MKNSKTDKRFHMQEDFVLQQRLNQMNDKNYYFLFVRLFGF